MAISKNVRITQTADPATYCRIYRGATTYNITGLNQGNKTFTLAENIPYMFLDNSTFTIAGSTGNDGSYSVNGNATGTGPITITVDQVIPDATVDGTIGVIWTNADALVFSVTNIAAVKLWEDASDVMYVGKAAAFGFVGYGMAVAPVGYGTFAAEYSIAGPSWATLTVLDNNTSGFTQRGFLEWVIPGAWASITINGTAAYWIRVSQGAVSPSVAAQIYHLLPNMTLNPPLTVKPEPVLGPDQRFHYDISETLRQTDTDGKQARKLTIGCTHLAATMMQLNMMRYWLDYEKRLLIEDLSLTDPPSMTTDAMYKTYSGFLVTLPGEIESPGKMIPAEYSIEFFTDTITSLITTLGITS